MAVKFRSLNNRKSQQQPKSRLFAVPFMLPTKMSTLSFFIFFSFQHVYLWWLYLHGQRHLSGTKPKNNLHVPKQSHSSLLRLKTRRLPQTHSHRHKGTWANWSLALMCGCVRNGVFLQQDGITCDQEVVTLNLELCCLQLSSLEAILWDTKIHCSGVVLKVAFQI